MPCSIEARLPDTCFCNGVLQEKNGILAESRAKNEALEAENAANVADLRSLSQKLSEAESRNAALSAECGGLRQELKVRIVAAEPQQPARWHGNAQKLW